MAPHVSVENIKSQCIRHQNWTSTFYLGLTIQGGKTFSKLDLAHAYQHIPLDEASKILTTIHTSMGLYQYIRPPFSAPAIFQKVMENILQGMPNVSIHLDDILVTGKTDHEHLETLKKTISRL